MCVCVWEIGGGGGGGWGGVGGSSQNTEIVYIDVESKLTTYWHKRGESSVSTISHEERHCFHSAFPRIMSLCRFNFCSNASFSQAPYMETRVEA